MRVSVSQIYIEAGVSFPFSYAMQQFLKEELTGVASDEVASAFLNRYGSDYGLMIHLSAKRGIDGNEVVGPTVSKKDKLIEYTLFLPFDRISKDADGRRAAARLLVRGIRDVFAAAGVDVAGLESSEEALVERLCEDATMLKRPWPASTS